MFAPQALRDNDPTINSDLKLDLQHIPFKGLRLAATAPAIVSPSITFCYDPLIVDDEDPDYDYADQFHHHQLHNNINYYHDDPMSLSYGSTAPIDVLPNEVFVHIFSYLNPNELFTVASICHRWRFLAEEESLWKDQVVLGCNDSRTKAQALLKHFAPLLGGGVAPHARNTGTAAKEEADRDRATGLSRWKSVWIAQKKSKANWRTGTFRRQILAKKHTAAIFCLAVGEDHIATGSSDHSVRVWNLHTGKSLHEFKGHQYAVWNIALTGSVVTSASYDGTLRMWDINNGKHLATLRGHASAIWGLDIQHNKIVSSSTDTFIRVWDMETGQCERNVFANQDTIWSAQFLDQNTVITGGSDIRVWDMRIDAATAGPVAQFSGHSDAIRCLQADRQIVVSGSYDNTIGVWDRVAGRRLWELSGHTDSITTLQYDQAGKLVTSSFDQSFRVWDLREGVQIGMWGKASSSNNNNNNNNNSHNNNNNNQEDHVGGPYEVQQVNEHGECGPAHKDEGGKVYALRFDDHRLVTGREDFRVRIDDFSARSVVPSCWA